MDLVDKEDERIMHLYRIYAPDKDFEGFKARVIHLGSRNNSEYGMQEDRPSSMTTAGFNRSVDYLSRFSHGSSGMYGSRVNQFRPPTNNRIGRPETREKDSEYGMPTDRYLPIIINLEHQNFLNEQTASIIKNFILEENVEVFRLINSYIAKIIDDHELCSKLIRFA